MHVSIITARCIYEQKAYQDWLCATSLPYYMNGYNIKPCISFCERVEQRCPYLHPTVKEQYGGQPVFICRGKLTHAHKKMHYLLCLDDAY